MFSKIWKDPVWASVIASCIFGLIVFTVKNVQNNTSNNEVDNKKGTLTGDISISGNPNICTNSKNGKLREVTVTLLNTNIKPQQFNICKKFEFKNIEGIKGKKISYKAKSGLLHDDGILFLWENKKNLIVLR